VESVPKLEKLFLNPFIGGVTAVLTVLAGAMASFYTAEIKANLVPWPWTAFAELSVQASGFWASIFAVGTLFVGAQWASHRQSTRAREAARIQVQALSSLVSRIETLPSEDFLASYQTFVRNAGRSALVAINSPDNAALLDPAIRNILAAILEVARKYDSAEPEATYAANIMLFRADQPMEAKKPVSIVDHVAAGAAGEPGLEGVLEVVRSLSTTSNLPGNGPDQDVAELVIPVPKETKPAKSGNLAEVHPVLPGAAWAFVYKEFAGFATLDKLDEWLRLRSSASPESKEAIRSYFREGGAGAKISSFASRPACGPWR
jgi:hypothetical protein